ncbi:MAG TPA: class I SAM-dependent methyltransferase [Thermoanaerobaculia bacterium]|nr:class I SAM-dependent methyltransferase [Thermoanaerobaculia bacterium]
MFEATSYLYFEDINWGLLRLWGERRGLDVLDAGCGFATTSQFIERRGNRVTGIESNAEAVKVARTRISRVVERDLQNFAPDLGTFDVIVFADVLEHLAWPVGVLKKYRSLLKPGGTVIVSLPNVGLWSVRLQHLLGRFEYEETGVLDRTHLRFFTRRSALRMLDEAGLHVIKRTYNPGLVRPFIPLVKKMLAGGARPDAILESRAYKLYLKTVHPVEAVFARLWPGMLAFQMIFEAVPK